jgi:hypothetical protein
MINCNSAVKTLEELRLFLIENGVFIPTHVTEELIKGRSLASICSLKPDDAEQTAKVMTSLEVVEMNLLSLTERHFDGETADMWQFRIKDSYVEQSEHATTKGSVSGFFPGIPTGEHFARIKMDYLDTVKGVDELLGRFTVTARKQEDGFLLIHGKKEEISDFLEAVRDKVRDANQANS